ncbi:insulysin unit 3 (M16 family) [Reticulomyxa filosa]|uniref:Insulysin unit 3 (M16 family) n=1 Tax=Reticulomyxa filosa TaxID=46433 RepID=X6NSV2_RETFI|nr:insulysin unit 3 (M16 family) [Reticulomyxa filosa]|eukprot:ETO29023.1 insulysin unit 3 (M16 family) [Reticulomyxa filosa]
MLTTLLFLCFQDVMSELTYTFTEASLSSYAAFDNVSGINVDFFGYNQKLPALVETVLSKLGNFELSEDQFEVNLERYKRQIQSIRKTKGHQQVALFENYILYVHSIFCLVDCVIEYSNDRAYSLEDMEQEVEKVTYKGLLKHYQNLFEEIFVEGLIYGNAEPDQIKQIYAKLIQKYILKDGKSKVYPLKDYLVSRKGALKIPANGLTHTLRFENFNSNDNNSAIGNNYFYTADTPVNQTKIHL